jgi:hypothetical protein
MSVDGVGCSPAARIAVVVAVILAAYIALRFWADLGLDQLFG